MAEIPLNFPSLAAMPLLDVLRLIRSENVGPITFFQLIHRYGSAKAALEALPELSRRGGRGKPLIPCPVDAAEREIAAARRHGARMVTYGAPDYPPLLHAIADPPPVLTALGSPQCWQGKNLAIVGARNASANGCHFAGKLAVELGKQGVTIVSGLARGIDTAAHKGATATVAVVAGGVDHVYPPENEKLYHQIIARGAVVSEQPFGSLPFATSFPARNRIISGMSQATAVIEASLRSGSLITARMAAEQGREVLAVPGSPLDPRSQGCNSLIRQGATLLESAQDALEALRAPAFGQARPVSFTLSEGAFTPSDEQEETDVRAVILEKLNAAPVPVDELIAQCRCAPGALQSVLLELELAGRLQRHPGNQVSLVMKEELA